MNCHTLYTGRTPRVLRRGAALAALFLLAGCDLPGQKDVAVGYRNPTVTLAATTRFDADRFMGDWQTVACIGTCATRARYVELTEGVFRRETTSGVTSYMISPPGVMREMGGDETLVVMWVDEGFRTAAIGDADGRWAAVIDRTGHGGADRVKAAIEVLDFNGWDVTKLRRVKG